VVMQMPPEPMAQQTAMPLLIALSNSFGKFWRKAPGRRKGSEQGGMSDCH
jgi:hypothetical protein